MDACAARRLFLFPLLAPKLPPAYPPRRRRRGRGNRAWNGAARSSPEANGGWGGIVEDDLAELLQVHFCFHLLFFPPSIFTVPNEVVPNAVLIDRGLGVLKQLFKLVEIFEYYVNCLHSGYVN